MIKDKEGAAKKLDNIPTGHQISSAVTSVPQYYNRKGAGSSVSAKPTHPNGFIEILS